MTPRVITVDKNVASPKALTEMKVAETIPAACELRQSKFLNTLIEPDHRAHHMPGQTRHVMRVLHCEANVTWRGGNQ